MENVCKTVVGKEILIREIGENWKNYNFSVLYIRFELRFSIKQSPAALCGKTLENLNGQFAWNWEENSVWEKFRRECGQTYTLLGVLMYYIMQMLWMVGIKKLRVSIWSVIENPCGLVLELMHRRGTPTTNGKWWDGIS